MIFISLLIKGVDFYLSIYFFFEIFFSLQIFGGNFFGGRGVVRASGGGCRRAKRAVRRRPRCRSRRLRQQRVGFKKSMTDIQPFRVRFPVVNVVKLLKPVLLSMINFITRGPQKICCVQLYNNMSKCETFELKSPRFYIKFHFQFFLYCM